MHHTQMMQYEELLLERSKEIRRLQDEVAKLTDANNGLLAYEDIVVRQAQEIRKLLDDNTKLLDDLDILEEKQARLEMDVSNLEDDYTDQASLHNYEIEQKDKEITALKDMVHRMTGYANDDAKTMSDLIRKADRQAGDIDYLEKLSAAFEECCDNLEDENKTLKNARDGLLTFSANEVERLTEEVRTLKYMRDIDDQLILRLNKAWQAQLVRLVNYDKLLDDGTLAHLLDDADILEEHGQYTAAEDIQRVVRIIKEDARNR